MVGIELISNVACALWFAYEVPAVANTGQTLGKRMLGIQVVGVEGAARLGFDGAEVGPDPVVAAEDVPEAGWLGRVSGAFEYLLWGPS